VGESFEFNTNCVYKNPTRANNTIEIADWVSGENKDINVNDTVTWKNNTDYSISMVLENSDGEPLAESQELQVGNDFSYTFENTGQYVWEAYDLVTGGGYFFTNGSITVQNL